MNVLPVNHGFEDYNIIATWRQKKRSFKQRHFTTLKFCIIKLKTEGSHHWRHIWYYSWRQWFSPNQSICVSHVFMILIMTKMVINCPRGIRKLFLRKVQQNLNQSRQLFPPLWSTIMCFSKQRTRGCFSWHSKCHVFSKSWRQFKINLRQDFKIF